MTGSAVPMRIKGRAFTYVINDAEEGGYTAHCLELPQVHTEGETLVEVKKNMRDALNLTMDYLVSRSGRSRITQFQAKIDNTN